MQVAPSVGAVLSLPTRDPVTKVTRSSRGVSTICHQAFNLGAFGQLTLRASAPLSGPRHGPAGGPLGGHEISRTPKHRPYSTCELKYYPSKHTVYSSKRSWS